jgi:hypothetical protein
MNMSEFPSSLLVDGAIILGLLAVLWQVRALVALRREMRDTQTACARMVAAMQRDVGALLDGSRGVSDTIHAHHRHIRQLLARQDKLELYDSGEARYREAVALLGKGASEQELVQTCGLSRGEAQLVVHLNHLRKAS